MSGDDALNIFAISLMVTSAVVSVTCAAKRNADKLRSLNMCEPLSIQRVFDGPTVEEMEDARRRVLVSETHARVGRDWTYWLWCAGLTGVAGIIQLLRALT